MTERSNTAITGPAPIRAERARAILKHLESHLETAVPGQQRAGTLRWLEQCLQAHERDTLAEALIYLTQPEQKEDPVRATESPS